MLVHRAWHGSWCWDAVVDRLHRDGIASVTVDNPSVTRPGSDLRDTLQRSCATRIGDVIELPTGHPPFASRPDDRARLLASFASRWGRQPAPTTVASSVKDSTRL